MEENKKGEMGFVLERRESGSRVCGSLGVAFTWWNGSEKSRSGGRGKWRNTNTRLIFLPFCVNFWEIGFEIEEKRKEFCET